ncbi:MAG: DNA mismatch repair protein MutS, partial [Pseudomonadota bacterium]|nr:DNA mismatch repair protein MutS [Pseudomonadota bacterium]
MIETARFSDLESVKLTPMLDQYWHIKSAHPDSLLWYRMGDFYELFFEDAETASKALSITLTKRGTANGKPIPMCGVPHHSHVSYLQRLTRQGHHVAICEQMEDPVEARKRKTDKLVRRAVTRIVTPGTITEDTLLDARSSNYLASLAEVGGTFGLAWLDISTGAFIVQPVDQSEIEAALVRLDPCELLIPDRIDARPELRSVLALWRAPQSVLPASRFDSENARRILCDLYGYATLDALGAFSRAEVAAAGTLVDYVRLTQCGRIPRLARLARLGPSSVMEIDAATRRSLELVNNTGGGRRGTLLATVDRTVTASGARLLADRIAMPLTDPDAINTRLDMVAFFCDAVSVRGGLRIKLSGLPDLERAMSRLLLGRGGPRDLAVIRDVLTAIPLLRNEIHTNGLTPPPSGIAVELAAMGDHSALAC